MTNESTGRHLLPSQLALIVLASAIAVPAIGQQTPSDTPPSATSAQTTPSASVTKPVPEAREGFWGHVNPFARKKWVQKQTDPINNRLSELDEVNAKNASDIKDVDDRAQAGINKAQTAADAANQTATAAGIQAQNANGIAQTASGHVDQLNTTVNGLDKYKQVTDVDITFRAGSPVLSADAKKQLDDLATSVTGHDGYILEMEAHSPHAGSAGIQNSRALG